jgi:hypothetical protein
MRPRGSNGGEKEEETDSGEEEGTPAQESGAP